MTNYIMTNPQIKGSGELSVPAERVQKFQSKGWVLKEGQKFKPPKVKGGRVLEVDDGLAARTAMIQEQNAGKQDGEDKGDGGDNGKPLPDGAVVKTVDMTLVDQTGKTPGMNLPGLSGKSKEVLLGIAKSENIQVDINGSKPAIKAAIEAERAARAGQPLAAADDADDDSDTESDEK